MRRSVWGRRLTGLLVCVLMVMGLLILPMGTDFASAQTGVPTIATSGILATVKAGAPAVVVDPGVTLSGFDTIDGAAVTINTGFVSSEDQLSLTNPNGIAWSYNSATGVLSLSGSASSAAYQAALRSVTYRNTNANSTHFTPRTVTFSVGAGTLYSDTTGHFYQFIVSPGISWTAARDAAANRSLYGLVGYLATITSAAENGFVTAKLQGTGWIGASDAAQEGVWRWVTGPEAGTLISYQFKVSGTTCLATTAPGVNGQYVNWAGGEPNDCGSYPPGNHAEDYAHYYTNGTWNDYPNTAGVTGYVVEYGGMAGDSQPVLSADATVIVIDGAPPVISGAPTTQPNANNWYNRNVTVHFTCTDAGSGIASCTADQQVSQEGVNQSVTGTATDRAGNNASTTVSGINVDKTAPVTTISAPDTWQNHDVPVTLTATDNLSGVAAVYHTVDGGAQQPGTSFTLSNEGSHTIAYWSVDKAGNTEATHTATVQIDKTAPTISGAADRSANGAGWYNAEVTVTFTCADALSGIATCTQPQTLGEGRQQSVTGTATDNAGNTASATVADINIDTTAPVTTISAPAAWQNQDVPVSLAATDNLSGVAATFYTVDGGAQNPGTSFTVSAEGAHDIAYWSVDAAGNAEAPHTATVQIDKTNPTISGAPDRDANGAGWYNADVTVTFTCADGLSGIASCSPAKALGEGTHQSATGTAVDNAGNTASATVSGINVDKTAPTISGAPDRAANGAGWYKADVTISFTCGDALSGIAACTGPQNLGEGAGQSVTGDAADKAGNTASATVSGINVDKTAPTISGAPDRDANGAGWYDADVTVSFTCADGLSGVAACTGPETLGEGTHQSASGAVTDKAGNTASTTVSGINIDKTAPVVTYTGNAGTYSVDQKVLIKCTATDSRSGLASSDCADIVGPAYSFALGTNTFTATATDKAGNSTTITVSFTVTVSNTSLCSLTKQFVKDKGLANSLCVKLDNAAKQAAAGNREASVNILQAYMNEVAAQTGKALTTDQAAILTRLAEALTN